MVSSRSGAKAASERTAAAGVKERRPVLDLDVNACRLAPVSSYWMQPRAWVRMGRCRRAGGSWSQRRASLRRAVAESSRMEMTACMASKRVAVAIQWRTILHPVVA